MTSSFSLNGQRRLQPGRIRVDPRIDHGMHKWYTTTTKYMTWVVDLAVVGDGWLWEEWAALGRAADCSRHPKSLFIPTMKPPCFRGDLWLLRSRACDEARKSCRARVWWQRRGAWSTAKQRIGKGIRVVYEG